MRTFHDSSGGEWTVFEVRRAVSIKGADLSHLPGGYSDGWLCFENATTKRRLLRYPERWREMNDTQLEKLLAQAALAPRPNLRLGDDLSGDGSTSRDARSD